MDKPKIVPEIMLALSDIAQDVPVIFPAHPRTRRRLEGGGWKVENENFNVLDPLGIWISWR